MNIVEKIELFLNEDAFQSGDRLEAAMDTVKQKIAAEDDPEEKERLEERLRALTQRWVEAMRAGRDAVKGKK